MSKTFIYRVTPTRAEMLSQGPSSDEAAVLERHFSYLEGAAGNGIVVLAGRSDTTTPDSFGIVIFRAEDETTARQFMNGDPAVAEGVMDADLYPFRLAIQVPAT